MAVRGGEIDQPRQQAPSVPDLRTEAGDERRPAVREGGLRVVVAADSFAPDNSGAWCLPLAIRRRLPELGGGHGHRSSHRAEDHP
jgi:hypothetical protein